MRSITKSLPIHVGAKDRGLARFHPEALESFPDGGAVVQTSRRRIQREGCFGVCLDGSDCLTAVGLGIVMRIFPFIIRRQVDVRVLFRTIRFHGSDSKSIPSLAGGGRVHEEALLLLGLLSLMATNGTSIVVTRRIDRDDFFRGQKKSIALARGSIDPPENNTSSRLLASCFMLIHIIFPLFLRYAARPLHFTDATTQ